MPTHFIWRGNGILSLFSSEWDVVASTDEVTLKRLTGLYRVADCPR